MAASRNVEYEVDADEVLYLEKEDFDKFVYDETSQGTEVDELWFTSLPSSSKGVLYFDYDGRDEYEVEKRESFTRRDLDDLAFVPDEDYDGSVTIGFSGESDQGENFSGTLYIEVNGTGRSSSDGEVTYEVDVNDAWIWTWTILTTMPTTSRTHRGRLHLLHRPALLQQGHPLLRLWLLQ